METRWRTKKLRFIILFSLGLSSLILGLYGYGVISGPLEGVKQSSVAGDLLTSREVDDDSVSIEKVGAKRKNIYDRNLKELAVSFMISSVYAKPLELRGDQGALQKISGILGIEGAELTRKVASERSFVWVARNVEQHRAEKIKALHLAGIYLTNEEVRLYPRGRHGGHVIGFAKGDQGLAGIEAYYENVLMENSYPGAANLQAAGVRDSGKLEGKGASLILALDMGIQEYLEKKLATLIKKSEASSGMAIIMIPESGEILAMANIPNYDPNFFWKSTDFERRNRLVSEALQGSAFLMAFRMAAEIEGGNIPDFILNGEEIAQEIIEPRLYKKAVSAEVRQSASSYWQELSGTQYWSAPEKSFPFLLSEEKLLSFSQRFGLTGRTVVDLPTFGQTSRDEAVNVFEVSSGEAPTALHLITAFSRLLTGNMKTTPHLLKDIWLEEQGEKMAATFALQKDSVDRVDNEKFIRLFNELSPTDSRKAIFIDSLTPNEEEVLVERLDVQTSLVGEETDLNSSDITGKRHYFEVAIGAMPSHKPEIAMVLVLDGVVVNLAVPSVSRDVVEEILSRSLVLWKVLAAGGTPGSRLQEDELFGMWSKLHRERGRGRDEIKKHQTRKMPKLKGLSLRKSLQILQEYDVRIQVVGSGAVIIQHPAPGAVLKEGDSCLLELAVNQ